MPIYQHIYENGFTLVAEPMQSLESVAFAFLVPLGSAYDSASRAGLANVVCEMTLRGCGERDSRQFVMDLEGLGVESGESVSVSHTCFRGAMLSTHLADVLPIYRDVLLHARFPEDELEAGRQVAVQELRAVDDDLSQKVMMELRRGHYPEPWGQSHQGDIDGLMGITMEDVCSQYAGGYRPNGTILGVAGQFDWDQLKDLVGELFGEWQMSSWEEPAAGMLKVHHAHLACESNQTHIAVAYPSAPYSHEDYFQAWGSVGVLSGGSSSRLFMEVREKRGLCYSVAATSRSLKHCGSVFCHAGTRADRAQETLDVMLAEIVRLAAGIEADELDRLKARMKSSLIMAQESSMARAAAIAKDWYYLNRVRTLEEIGQLVDALTPESINAYLKKCPPKQFSVVTLGLEALEVSVGVS
ncbi:MAG: pitrilysin family protein [Pirellulales bacterium]|nr:pitrilysin family protein [Pirellulales bacterium]